MAFERIPNELKKRRQWGVHVDKRPLQNQTKPEQWLAFDDAVDQVDARHGLAWFFSPNDRYIGVDLDGCRDPETGKLEPWADDVLHYLPRTYTEISPSGTGLKMIFWLKGEWPYRHRKSFEIDREFEGKKPAIELQYSNSIFAITGRGETEEIGELTIERLLDEISRAPLTEQARGKLEGRKAADAQNEAEIDPTDDADVIGAATRYVLQTIEAVDGEGGSDRFYRVGCEAWRFGLDRESAKKVMEAYNDLKCEPPFEDHEIEHKLDDTFDRVLSDGEFGSRHAYKISKIDVIAGFSDGVGTPPTIDNSHDHHDTPTESARDSPRGTQLSDVPGFINEIRDFILEITTAEQPWLATAAALSLLNNLIGSRGSSMLSLSLARSGEGKNAPQQAIAAICKTVGADYYTRFSSDVAMEKQIVEGPFVFICDEFHKKVSDGRANRDDRMLNSLLEFYNSGRYTRKRNLSNTVESDGAKNVLTLYASAITEELQKAFTSGDVSSGLLPRFLVFEGIDNPVRKNRPEDFDVPEDIKRLAESYFLQDLGNDPVKPPTVPDWQFEDHLRPILDKMQSLDEGTEKTLLSRVVQNSIKLAVLATLSDDKRAEHVTEQALVWAVEAAMHSNATIQNIVDVYVAESKPEGDVKYVQRQWAKHAAAGFTTRSRLTVITQHLEKFRRIEAFEYLKAAGELLFDRIVNVDTMGRSRNVEIVFDPRLHTIEELTKKLAGLSNADIERNAKKK